MKAEILYYVSYDSSKVSHLSDKVTAAFIYSYIIWLKEGIWDICLSRRAKSRATKGRGKVPARI